MKKTKKLTKTKPRKTVATTAPRQQRIREITTALLESVVGGGGVRINCGCD